MRPVKPNPNPSYQIPATMVTLKDVIIAGLKYNLVDPVKGTKNTFKTPQVISVLLELTDQNEGKAKWGGLKGKDKALMPALINYFTENGTMKYGNARGALIDNYGQYCSYCGTPVQDTALAIEHCLPKAVFPSQMLNYDNFFLCCPSCNSNKGSKPTYADSLDWAKKTTKNPTIKQILQGGMDRQLWPNSPECFLGFPICLIDTLMKTPPIDMKLAIDLNNVFENVTDNIVYAKIIGYNNSKTVSVAAQQLMAYMKDPILKDQEDNFMKIVKINDFEKGNYSDRRITNRTITWLNTLTSYKLLNMFKPGSPEWLVMFQQMCSTIKSAGFYEQWLWLFFHLSPPGSGPNSVYLKYRTVSTDPNQPLYYFPGTDAAYIPIK